MQMAASETEGLPEAPPEAPQALLARFSHLNQRTKRLIRENPTVALVGALAFGYVVGRWASRSLWSR